MPARNRVAVAILALSLAFSFGGEAAAPKGSAAGVAAAPGVPGDLTLVPEAERPYRRLVIGLDPLLKSPYMLPEGSRFEGAGQKNAFVRRQLYWLDWELLHGRILSVLPKRTRLFVAVPDPVPAPHCLLHRTPH